MKHILLLTLPVLFLAVSCTPNPELEAKQAAKADAALSKQLNGLVRVGTDSCIPGGVSSTIIDDRHIVWREGVRGKAWVTTFDVPCSGMREGDALIIERFGSQLCRMDTVQPFTPGSSIPGPRCALGDFARYEKPKSGA